MSGRLLVSILLGVTLVFGVTLWYYQVYAYYQPVTLADPVAPQVEIVQPIAASDQGAGVDALPDGDATPTPETPSALGSPASGDAPDVDTAELAKPNADGSAVAGDPPVEMPSVDAQAKNDGTTPNDPDAANAGVLAAAADNIRVAALPGVTAIRMVRVWDNLPEVVAATDFEGIDADTSPLKFKGCFALGNSIPMLTETYVVYDNPTPLKAPIWFRCFHHRTLTEDLETGEAVAFLSEANITYGIDRVMAVYGDGRAFAWHQINQCGTAAFAGDPLPEGCPPEPER